MARPTTKEELLIQGKEKFQKLFELIDSLSKEEQVGLFPFEGRDKQIRDCLVHLHEWHLLFINWVNSNQKGKQVPFLPEPFNWKTYPEMNQQIWEKHQKTTLDDAKKLIRTSHNECLKLIDGFSNEELFTKKYYNWTGTTSLGSYAVSATSSHYEWALKLIRKYKRSLK